MALISILYYKIDPFLMKTIQPKMHSAYSFYIICYLFLFGVKLQAQELPPINNFTPKNYNGESQNWSVSQAKEGELFVANNLGLLEFNGAEWRLYPSPNKTIMRSVNVIDDTVFAGFYMDFGYWLRNTFGELVYTSLVKKYEIPVLEDEQFWNIAQFEEWVLFQSLQRIYFFNTKTKAYQIVSSDVKITKMFHVDGKIYFQKLSEGLFSIKNGAAYLVSDAPIFKEEDVINIHVIESQLTVLTSLTGFVRLENEKIKFWKEANRYLANKKIYNSIQLKNGGFAIGTISSGVLFLRANGALEYQISKPQGLHNNTVLSLFEDLNGAVWLGLDNGISSVNRSSNSRVFKQEGGKLGAVYATQVFKENLYVGTNQGLFVKRYRSNNKFELIKGTQGQVWSLQVIEGDLFCGHDKGTLIIEQNKINTHIDIQGTWSVKKIGKHTLLQGNYSGLHVLEKIDNRWRLKHKIKGFNNSSRSFEVLSEKTLFVNHEYKGVYKLQLDKDFKNVTALSKDKLVGKGLHSNIIKYRNSIYYADQKGVFKYDVSKEVFQKDTLLSGLYTRENYTTGKLVYDRENDALWGFSKKDISYAKPSTVSEKLTIKRIPISQDLRKSAQGFENLSIYKNDEILGINNGYILLNMQATEERRVGNEITINTISVNSIGNPKNLKDIGTKGEFSHTENTIGFRYNVAGLTKDINVEYQYKLEGYTDSWSPWSVTSAIDFDNLPRGKEYVFSVRAKIGNVLSSNSASYSFRITNPWYVTDIAIVCYAALLLFVLFVIDRGYRTYYRRQRRRLLEKQEKDFKLKVLANEKELIQSRNDQLRVDIESKSRELATSTMSIIKKNELLGSIKKALQDEGDLGVKSVVKIIDKNLSNTDDWQMFKEAFNNADKDFIKKLKFMHSNLTPNDLRLCAYLRLNLSSKEIAPLLNISSKSVEVKRYRLRKKLNLGPNDGLTDYVLNI